MSGIKGDSGIPFLGWVDEGRGGMSAKVLVQFSNVGCAKKSWQQEIPTHDDGTIDGNAMDRAIRKSKALASRDIEVDNDGGIYVGGFRRVGEWSLVAQSKEPSSTGRG